MTHHSLSVVFHWSKPQSHPRPGWTAGGSVILLALTSSQSSGLSDVATWEGEIKSWCKHPPDKAGLGSHIKVGSDPPISTTEYPPVQNLIAPAGNVAFGIVAGSNELVSKGLQSGNLFFLLANKGVSEVKVGLTTLPYLDCRSWDENGYFGRLRTSWQEDQLQWNFRSRSANARKSLISIITRVEFNSGRFQVTLGWGRG